MKLLQVHYLLYQLFKNQLFSLNLRRKLQKKDTKNIQIVGLQQVKASKQRMCIIKVAMRRVR